MSTFKPKKVVLAYSGGVDTSVCIPYLKQEWGVEEVITFAADLGQGDELEPIRQKALDSGASQSIVGDLIEDYEAKHHPLPEVTGVQALKFLMEQHGLKQSDLSEIGSQGVVSEILTGKRELNIRQVRALSERFGVSAATFV